MLKPIRFYSHTQKEQFEIGYDLRSCSNLYPQKIILTEQLRKYWPYSDNEYKYELGLEVISSENVFQAFKKYNNPKYSEFCLKLASPIEAAKIGQGRLEVKKLNKTKMNFILEYIPEFQKNKRPVMTQEAIIKFDNLSPHLMMELIRHKTLSPDMDLYKIMMIFAKDYDKILFVEHTENDKRWGDKLDGTGSNILGKILTYRLKELVLKCNIELDIEFLNKSNNNFVSY